MRVALLVLLVARAVVGGTNRSLPDETPQSGCDSPTAEGIPPLSAESLPESILAGRQVATDIAQTVATMISGQQADFKKIASHSRAMLEKHPELASTALAFSQHRGSAMYSVAYHKEDKIRVSSLHSRNQTSEAYWRTLESAWNQSSRSGMWSQPFWDCYSDRWVFGYSVPLPGQHRGAAGIFFPLDRLNIDECNESFSGSHKCESVSTQCMQLEGRGLRKGYTCICRPGFYSKDLNWRSFIGDDLDKNDGLEPYRCERCPDECDTCDSNGACMARQDHLLRTVVLGVQVLCMCITLVLAIIVFKQRKCKTIASGMWTILETILLGILLLYATVVVRFFNPSVEQCLLEPWCRELGFVICYGAIILKLYRILIEFRTRKAHRWVVRDKDLLKYLLGMILVVFGYMAAWTATNLDFIQENYSVLTLGRTYEGLQFLACKALWWDYVTETGEILILVFGIHLSYACRNATTQFQERRFLCMAIAVEATVSGVFYVLRFMYWGTLHPDLSFLAYFIRSQLTSTVVLLVIFTPKLWYQHKQVTDSRGTRHYLTQEFSARMPLDAFKPQDGLSGANNSDVEVGEINLADMNPEDIRAELKRLYTQLEVLKNKTIRTDNPHISKRRGGRKVAHRRFSLQKKGSREKALHHRHQRCSTRHLASEHEPTEGEASRTPEDSVCSIEGPSAIYNEGPSTYSDMGYGTPNVSYRVSHKQ